MIVTGDTAGLMLTHANMGLQLTHTCPCDRVGCLNVKDELATMKALLTEAVSLFKNDRIGLSQRGPSGTGPNPRGRTTAHRNR